MPKWWNISGRIRRLLHRIRSSPCSLSLSAHTRFVIACSLNFLFWVYLSRSDSSVLVTAFYSEGSVVQKFVSSKSFYISIFPGNRVHFFGVLVLGPYISLGYG